MSKLQELMKALCPDGVPFKPLGEISDMQRGSVITKNDAEEGNIPVIAGGQKPAYYTSTPNRQGETITVAGSGAYAGFVSYWNEPIFVSDAFSIKGTKEALTKYLYYHLVNMQDRIHSKKKGAGVPHVHIKDIDKFLIPVPPIEVQEEIVKILDRFAEYSAELQAELQARKEQYEYYRNLLLTFNPSAYGCGTDDEQEIKVTTWGGHSYEVTWKTMGEICNLNRGKRVVKNDLMESGSYPVFQNSLTPLGFFSEANYPADTTFVISAGAAGEIGYSDVPFWAADDCLCITCPNGLLSKYVYHCLINNQKYLTSRVRRASVPRLARTAVENLTIPVPPLELQEKIVAILDKFEALTNDLQRGLPAEIEAVKERYEYYRDKLLTFKPLAA